MALEIHWTQSTGSFDDIQLQAKAHYQDSPLDIVCNADTSTDLHVRKERLESLLDRLDVVERSARAKLQQILVRDGDNATIVVNGDLKLELVLGSEWMIFIYQVPRILRAGVKLHYCLDYDKNVEDGAVDFVNL